jgi:hypothetical protein
MLSLGCMRRCSPARCTVHPVSLPLPDFALGPSPPLNMHLDCFDIFRPCYLLPGTASKWPHALTVYSPPFAKGSRCLGIFQKCDNWPMRHAACYNAAQALRPARHNSCSSGKLTVLDPPALRPALILPLLCPPVPLVSLPMPLALYPPSPGICVSWVLIKAVWCPPPAVTPCSRGR